jgi:CRP/FNR family cyclic AMP-dependent transcriptional regulator
MPSVPENSPVLQRQSSQKEVEISAASLAVHHNARQNLQVHLRKIPLLANLTDDEIIKVKADLRIRQYTKREVVLQKGGSGDGLLFLLAGQLQVIDVTEDGRAIGLRMLAPGDFFGEIAVINGSTRSASVVAMSEVLVAFLPAPTALHLFSHSPSVANHMLRYLAQKIQRDSEFRALLSINNTAKRIYTYLSLLKQSTSNEMVTIENLPTHQDIANMINTSRESVTRALLTLVQQGIVEKEAHRLIIRDPEALQKLVQAPG